MVKVEEKVSVIVPIYNAEKYLEDCVNSIIRQIHTNLQIILINDGSQDKSWEICQRLKEKDRRIVISSQKNQGVSVARNKGLEIANGKWIMFVDPDDFIDENIINKLLNKSDKGRDIICCSCIGFKENNFKEVAHFFKGNQLFENNKKNDLYLQLLDSNYEQQGKAFTAIGVPWGKLYRRSFIEKYNLRFDSKLRRAQDNVFNMYAFNYARSVYYLDEPLYYYRLGHVKKYNQKNLKNTKKIFLPVIKAKYEALNTLGLYNNKLIHIFYLNEAASIFMGIINGEISTNIKYNVIKNDFQNLKCLEYFRILFTKKGKKNIRHRSMRAKLAVVTYGMPVYIFIYRCWNIVKRKV